MNIFFPADQIQILLGSSSLRSWYGVIDIFNTVGRCFDVGLDPACATNKLHLQLVPSLSCWSWNNCEYLMLSIPMIHDLNNENNVHLNWFRGKIIIEPFASWRIGLSYRLARFSVSQITVCFCWRPWIGFFSSCFTHTLGLSRHFGIKSFSWRSSFYQTKQLCSQPLRFR